MIHSTRIKDIYRTRCSSWTEELQPRHRWWNMSYWAGHQVKLPEGRWGNVWFCCHADSVLKTKSSLELFDISDWCQRQCFQMPARNALCSFGLVMCKQHWLLLEWTANLNLKIGADITEAFQPLGNAIYGFWRIHIFQMFGCRMTRGTIICMRELALLYLIVLH